MSELTPTYLREAIAAARRTGLLRTHPGEPPWTRVACPACGGALDVPAPGGGLTTPGQSRFVRRVDAFAFRHQSPGAHR